jgi:hypothetical protein
MIKFDALCSQHIFTWILVLLNSMGILLELKSLLSNFSTKKCQGASCHVINHVLPFSSWPRELNWAGRKLSQCVASIAVPGYPAANNHNLRFISTADVVIFIFSKSSVLGQALKHWSIITCDNVYIVGIWKNLTHKQDLVVVSRQCWFICLAFSRLVEMIYRLSDTSLHSAYYMALHVWGLTTRKGAIKI